jgi:hypothetical protein
MFISRINQNVASLCAEIDDLRYRLAEAEYQAKYWRDEHAKLVTSHIHHGQKMMAGMLGVALASTKDAKAVELGRRLARDAAK